MKYLGFILLEYIALFFLSRSNIKFIFKILRKGKLAAYFLALLFFPGTVLHELSHFFAAIALFLRVGEVEIFPKIEGEGIRLGRVYYERKDFLRSLIVGIAPIFAGSAVLFGIFYFDLFPANDFFKDLIFGYLIFSVSSTMFSSKQDLKDLGLVVPLGLFLVALVYIFEIRINLQYLDKFALSFVLLIKALSVVIFVQTLINFALRVIFFCERKIFYKIRLWN